MKFRRKFIVTTLTLSLASILASCGGGGESGSSGTPTVTPASTPVSNSNSQPLGDIVNSSLNITDITKQCKNWIQGTTFGQNSKTIELCHVATAGLSSLPISATTTASTSNNFNYKPQSVPIVNSNLITQVNHNIQTHSNLLQANTKLSGSSSELSKQVASVNQVSIYSFGFTDIFTGNNLLTSQVTTLANWLNFNQSTNKQVTTTLNSVTPTSLAIKSPLKNSVNLQNNYNLYPYYQDNFIFSKINQNNKIATIANFNQENTTSIKDNNLTLDGTNVRVGIIDTEIKPKDYTAYFRHVPIDIGTIEKFAKGHTAINGGNHALDVAAIIAGKRSVDLSSIKTSTTTSTASTSNSNNLIANVGLAPGVQIYAAGLWNSEINGQSGSTNFDIGKALTYLFNTYKPSIINGSIQFSSDFTTTPVSTLNSLLQSESVLATAKPTIPTVTNSKVTNEEQSLINSAITITQEPHSPLLVFATGNYNEGVLQNKFKTLTIEQQKEALANKNWGLAIPDSNDNFIRSLTKSLASSNTIVVTGVEYDIDGSLAKAAYDRKYKVVEQEKQTTAISKNEPTVQSNKNNNYQYSTKNFISAYGAVQCGAAEFNCLAAGFTYYLPSQLINTNSSNTIAATNNQEVNKASNLATYVQYTPFNGTSAAAPVVSAVAAIVKQQFPWFSAENLKATILTTATDVGAPGVDPVFGWGVINAGSAIKGPANFAFGDFIADMTGNQSAGYQQSPSTSFSPNLSNNTYKYYFTNNIIGNGGLIVKGYRNQYLYLTGTNVYTGNTVIDSGNLVIAPIDIVLGKSNYTFIDHTKDKTQNLAPGLFNSNVYVNNQGRLLAYNAQLKNITNNGVVLFGQANYVDTLIQKPNSQLVLNINYGDKLGQFVDLTITKQATLEGTVVINNNDNNILLSTSGAVQNQQQNLVPIISTADNGVINGTFSNAITTNASPLTSYSLYYSKDLKNVYLLANFIPIKQATPLLTANASNLDKKLIANSVNTLTNLFTESNQITKTANTANINYASNSKIATASSSINTNLNKALVNAVVTASVNNSDLHSKTSGVKVNSNYILSNKDKAIIKTVSAIQAQDPASLNRLLYANAGTVYASSQLANSFNILDATDIFTKHIGSFAIASASPKYLGNKFTVAKPLYQVYANYRYINHTWNNMQDPTRIFGQQNTQGIQVGVYGQYLGYNWGIATYQNSSNWNENLASTTIIFNTNTIHQSKTSTRTLANGDKVQAVSQPLTSLSPRYSQKLGVATLSTHGLLIGSGIARSNYFIQATGIIDRSFYNLYRSSLYILDQHAKFNTWNLGVNFKYGRLAYQNNNHKIITTAGITFINHYQSAFQETSSSIATTSNGTALPSDFKSLIAPLAFKAKSKNSFNIYTNIGAQYTYSAHLAKYKIGFTIEADLLYAITKPDFTLKLLDNGYKENNFASVTNNTSTENVFSNNNFLGNLSISTYIYLTSQLKLNINASYKMSKAWHTKEIQVGLNYTF